MSRQISLSCFARRFRDDTRAVSAVEFALLLPLMLTMYLGGIEVSQAIATSRKVTLVSRTVADLVSQASKVTSADMTAILNASATVLSPFPSGALTVTVSQVKIDGGGTATIEWSETLGGTKRSGSATVPAGLNVANTWLIWAEAQYNYVPTFGSGVIGSVTMSDQLYMRPRVSNSVTYP